MKKVIPIRPSHHAFSLVELLVVLAIISVLAALGGPAIGSLMLGSNLSRAGQILEAQLVQGRQEAVTYNHGIELIFFNLTGTARGWRAIQIWRVDQTATGTTTTPLTKVSIIPDGVIICPDATLSPLLNLLTTQDPSTNPTAITGTTTLPAFGTVQYVGFRFRANGATDSIIDTTHNFVTLVNANNYVVGTQPSNYYTLQVNPTNGKVTSFRP